jgi:hypothetical protein
MKRGILMSDLENIRWCPACQHESLDGDERFCKRCCKVFDQLFPDGKWHDMETDDLIEHYHCGADSVHVDDDEDDSGIPPVSDLNAPKKEEGKKVWHCRNCGFLYEGEEAPAQCPVCNHPQAYFELVQENY